MRRTLLVPAAGRGTRLGSPLPKLLTLVAGRPMIDWVLARHAPFCQDAVLVVRPDDRAAVASFADRARLPIVLVEQASATGMLDAILLGAPAALESDSDRVWITWCDQVLVSARTAERLAAADDRIPAPAAVFPTSRQSPPYIHFERDAFGRISGVRQRREGDAMPIEGESDSGLFSLSRAALGRALPEYATGAPLGARTREINFLPFLPWLAARSEIVTFDVPAIESLGINTPDDLADAEQRLKLPPTA